MPYGYTRPKPPTPPGTSNRAKVAKLQQTYETWFNTGKIVGDKEAQIIFPVLFPLVKRYAAQDPTLDLANVKLMNVTAKVWNDPAFIEFRNIEASTPRVSKPPTPLLAGAAGVGLLTLYFLIRKRK